MTKVSGTRARSAPARLATGATLIVGMLTFAPAASAITVDSTGDAGGCTLRAAIAAVNTGNHNGPCGPLAASGPTPINLPANTYTLSQGQLQIGSSARLAIIGANPNAPATTTIDAAETGRVFEVAAGAQVSMSAVRIMGGRTADGMMGQIPGSIGQVSGDGGGILNRGTLTLDHVILTENMTGTGGRGADGNTLAPPSSSQRDGGDGVPSGSGGGIFNEGGAVLVVTDSTISDNGTGTGGAGGTGAAGVPGGGNNGFAGGPGGTGAYSGSGGGILNFGNANISRTTISGNFTGRGGNGGQGGDSASETANNPAGSGGSGGWGGNGGWSYNSSSGNYGYTARLGGGGIYNFGTLTLRSSTLSGNTTGAGGNGGGAGLGGLRLNGDRSSSGAAGLGGSGGLGGGLLNNASILPAPSGGGNANLNDVTVSGNFTGDGGMGGAGGQSASQGGGFGGHGGYGGGIWGIGAYYAGSMQLTHATVAGNFLGGGGPGGAPGTPPPGGTPTPGPNGARGKGAGLATGGRFDPANGARGVYLKNTIIALNGAPASGDQNCNQFYLPAQYIDIGDLGNNLTFPAGDASCPGANADPQLGPLEDNGGPTETMLPQPGSAAIAAIPPASCVGITDQRGFARPGIGKTNCDVGAAETGPPPGVTPTTTTLSSSANPSTAGQAVTFTATISPSPSGGPVSFTDNGTLIPGCESVSLVSGGQASCTVTYPFALTHTIVASYAGNSLFAPSTSSPLVQNVRAAPGPPGGGPTVDPPTPPTAKKCKRGQKLKGGRCVKKKKKKNKKK